MKAIAATRIFDELPPMDEVLARKVTVLGSTGSIGVNTLDVIAHVRKLHGADALPIAALTAGENVKVLIEQARAMKPGLAVIGNEQLFGELKEGLAGTGIEVGCGRQAVIDAGARQSDFVMVAIMGAAAIEPALAAIGRGVVVALANKVCVVAAGAVFRDAITKSGAQVLPVDSEHNAIFQVLGSGDASEADLVTITASGGPFREWTLERMRAATVEEAVAHPNWAMGRKISLDSATLMNKGLELIEAHFLFALAPEKLSVVVHPQSIVHCLVSYADGATMAHLSAPDMRTPIAHALGWPRRIPSPSRRLDLARLGSLVFQPPDHDRFPALGLAGDAMRAGGLACTVLNAANEIAVQAFLDRQIGFLDICEVVEATLAMDMPGNGEAADLATVLDTDARARAMARQHCRGAGTDRKAGRRVGT
jgi:1-deoxy-D-xylulose-5-phosphate reductoisomerase